MTKVFSFYIIVFLVIIALILSWFILYKVPQYLAHSGHLALLWTYLLLVDAPVVVGIFLFV